jgi:hypothetical protein
MCYLIGRICLVQRQYVAKTIGTARGLQRLSERLVRAGESAHEPMRLRGRLKRP